MLEPAELANFFTIFFTSAIVIVLGALYALLFAFSRIGKRPRLMPLAYLPIQACSSPRWFWRRPPTCSGTPCGRCSSP